jgi:type II secretory pathway component PulF
VARLADFYRGLAVLLRSGIVVPEALRQLEQNRGLPSALGRSLASVTDEGSTLAEALGRHPDEVPSEDVALIEAGETTGNLDENLDRLAALHEARRAAAWKLFMKSAYPIALFHLAALLVPFGTLGARGELSVNKSLRITLMILVPVWALAVTLWLLWRRADWRPRLRGWLEVIPGFGRAARHQRHAIFATVLDAGYEAGMPVDRALDLAVRVAAAGRAASAVERVEQGQPLAAALVPTGVLGARNLARVATAETAGELGPELRRIANDEFEAASRTLDLAVGVVSRGLYILVALWIAYYALTVIGAAYSM